MLATRLMTSITMTMRTTALVVISLTVACTDALVLPPRPHSALHAATAGRHVTRPMWRPLRAEETPTEPSPAETTEGETVAAAAVSTEETPAQPETSKQFGGCY